MPKVKVYYYDGESHTGWEEGKDGVVTITAFEGKAIIYFENGNTVNVTSPYMEVYTEYETEETV